MKTANCLFTIVLFTIYNGKGNIFHVLWQFQKNLEKEGIFLSELRLKLCGDVAVS